MPLMSVVMQTHPVIVSMPMDQSDDHWIEIDDWISSKNLDVIWSSNVDTSGIAPFPFLRHFCFKTEDREAAMLFKLTWL